MKPDHFPAYNNLSIIHREEGNYQDARELLEKARYLLPETGSVTWRQAWYKNYGILEFLHGNFVEARVWLYKGLNLEGLDSATNDFSEEIIYYLALLEEKEKTGQVCQTWQKYQHYIINNPRSNLFGKEQRQEDAESQIQRLNCSPIN